MICADSLTYLSLKAWVWDGFGAKLFSTDSISDHFEGLGRRYVQSSVLHVCLEAWVWDGFGTKLLITDSISDHFEGLGR